MHNLERWQRKAKSKKRDAIDSSVQSSIGGEAKETQADQPNPLGVKLTADEIADLDRIADELGVTRHNLLQYTVREFIRRYDVRRQANPNQKDNHNLRIKNINRFSGELYNVQPSECA